MEPDSQFTSALNRNKCTGPQENWSANAGVLFSPVKRFNSIYVKWCWTLLFLGVAWDYYDGNQDQVTLIFYCALRVDILFPRLQQLGSYPWLDKIKENNANYDYCLLTFVCSLPLLVPLVNTIISGFVCNFLRARILIQCQEDWARLKNDLFFLFVSQS